MEPHPVFKEAPQPEAKPQILWAENNLQQRQYPSIPTKKNSHSQRDIKFTESKRQQKQKFLSF